jgi:hypothetical protein
MTESRRYGAIRRTPSIAANSVQNVLSLIIASGSTPFADIVLPAASFLEFDDLVMAYFNLTVSAQVKVRLCKEISH